MPSTPSTGVSRRKRTSRAVTCPPDRHEKMKGNSVLTFVFMCDLVGIQYDRHGKPELVMANCPTCKATLAVEPREGEVL